VIARIFAAVIAALAMMAAAGCDKAPLAATRSTYQGCSAEGMSTACGDHGQTNCLLNPLSGQASVFDSLGYWCTRSCALASDCPSRPGSEPVCLALASRYDQGTFCALPCNLDHPDCPMDTTCVSVEPANGGDDPHYCLP